MLPAVLVAARLIVNNLQKTIDRQNRTLPRLASVGVTLVRVTSRSIVQIACTAGSLGLSLCFWHNRQNQDEHRMKFVSTTRRQGCSRPLALSLCAVGAYAQKTQLTRLHRARDRPAQGLRGRLQQGQPEHRDQVGARLDRRHHRQAAGREGQPAGRRRDGPGRLEPGAVRHRRHAGALRAAGSRPRRRAVSRHEEPAGWVGMDVWGATVCFNTVGRREAEHSQARDLEGPDQAGLQGPDRDAATRRRRAPASSTSPPGCRCGARPTAGSTWTACTRTSRSTCTRARALRGGGAGEYVVGISFEYRANREKAKGAPIDLVFPKEGLGWDLEAFAIHKGTKKLDAAQKLVDWASATTRWSCTPRTSRSSRCRRCRSRCRTCRPTTEAAWSRTTSRGRRRTATAILAEWSKRYDAKSAPK